MCERGQTETASAEAAGSLACERPCSVTWWTHSVRLLSLTLSPLVTDLVAARGETPQP